MYIRVTLPYLATAGELRLNHQHSVKELGTFVQPDILIVELYP